MKESDMGGCSVAGRAILGSLLLLQHLAFILLLLPLTSSGGSSSASSKNSSLPVYSVPSSASSTARELPTFLSASTLIQVDAGEVALLECRVTHLAAHHTVSWLRSEDVSVLTVGGLVFSSDPRLHVLSRTRPSERSGSWTLVVENCQPEDSGSYRCQVNTEPAKSKTFNLVVNKQEVEEGSKEEAWGRKSEDVSSTSGEILVGPHGFVLGEDFGDSSEVLVRSGLEANTVRPVMVSSEAEVPVVTTKHQEEKEEQEVEEVELLEKEKQSRSIVSVRLGEEGSRFSFAKVEVGEEPSDSPALEMRSQEEMEEVEVNKEE